MTVLDEIIIADNSILRKHEAPIHLSNSIQRLQWKYDEEPFFSSEIFQFWNLYCTPFSATDYVCLDPIENMKERKLFIKNPIYTVSKNNDLVGGLWQDSLGNNVYQIHIKFKRDNRKIAYPFFENYLYSIAQKKSIITVAWGPREKCDCPANFFRNFDFNVYEEKNNSGSASLDLKK